MTPKDTANSIDAGRLFGRGVAFPPRVGPDGRAAWSEGEANVREAIQIILRTEQGERLYLADFGAGLGKFLFEPNTVATRHQIGERIRKALQQWEPRILVTAIDVSPDAADAQAAIATIQYQLVATQVSERVRMRVSLAG